MGMPDKQMICMYKLMYMNSKDTKNDWNYFSFELKYLSNSKINLWLWKASFVSKDTLTSFLLLLLKMIRMKSATHDRQRRYSDCPRCCCSWFVWSCRQRFLSARSVEKEMLWSHVFCSAWRQPHLCSLRVKICGVL